MGDDERRNKVKYKHQSYKIGQSSIKFYTPSSSLKKSSDMFKELMRCFNPFFSKFKVLISSCICDIKLPGKSLNWDCRFVG